MAKSSLCYAIVSCSAVFILAYLLFHSSGIVWPGAALLPLSKIDDPWPITDAQGLSSVDQESLDEGYQDHGITVADEYNEAVGGKSGLIFNSTQTIITSPNGKYTLSFLSDANLVLTSAQTSSWLWSTGGGRLGRKEWDVRNHVMLDREGLLTIGRTWGDGDSQTTWHSNLLSQCAEPDDDQWKLSVRDSTNPSLRLTNSGELSIAGRCTIYIPPKAKKSRTLGMIVSGLYRTLNQTCHHHVEKFVEHPAFTTVDVFVYALYESKALRNGITPERIEADIRTCYGESLKSFTLLPVEAVQVQFPGDNASCGNKLNRLYAQLKTLYESAQAWQAYTIREGKLHDTVMRIRTDNNFWGEEQPHVDSLESLGQDILVLPHGGGEDLRQFYCPGPSGSFYQGSGDQIAYGSPAAMAAYLNMYRDFPLIVELAAPGKQAHHNFNGCETIPTGPRASDCKNPSSCSIECMVHWYLRSRGIQLQLEWTWNVGLLRG